MMSADRLLAGGAVIAALFFAGVSRAQPAVEWAVELQDQASARANRGLERYRAGDYGQAYELFRAAEQIHHAPPFELYMARCLEQLGRMLDARRLYREIVDEALPDGAPAVFVEAKADAKRELALLEGRIPAVTVVVTGVAPHEARVLLAGTPIVPGEPRQLDPGRYTIDATAKDAAPISRAVSLSAGRAVEIAIPFEVRRQADSSCPPPPPRWPLVAASGALGLGLAGIVTGAVAGAIALDRWSEVEPTCPRGCPISSKREVEAIDALAGVSTLGFAIGGVGLAGGAALWFLLPQLERTGDAPRPRRGLALHAGPGQLWLDGAF